MKGMVVGPPGVGVGVLGDGVAGLGVGVGPTVVAEHNSMNTTIRYITDHVIFKRGRGIL